MAAPRGIDAHLQNLQIAVDHPTAGITHQRRLGRKRHLRVGSVGGPPHAVGAPQLVGHERLVPRISPHHRRFQGRHLGHMARIQRLVGDALAVSPGIGNGRIVHGHMSRAALARQAIVDAGQAHPLVLLGIRQARVHGQRESRVMPRGIEGVALPRTPSGLQRQQEARTRRRPERLGQRRARTFDEIRVLAQAIPRNQAIGASHRAELFGEGPGLDHAISGQPFGPVLAQAVLHRVHLAAHGIGHNEQRSALARPPRAPGHRIQRRDAYEAHFQSARNALRRGQGDAHAGERSGPAAHAHAGDLLPGHVGLGAQLIDAGHKLGVRRPPRLHLRACHKLDRPRGSIEPSHAEGYDLVGRIEGEHISWRGAVHGQTPFRADFQLSKRSGCSYTSICADYAAS